jgi:hypothetical protein
MKQNKHKVKRNFGDWLLLSLDIGLHFFFFMFLLVYVNKYGLSNFVLETENTYGVLLNFCIWFTLIMYNVDKLFDGMRKHFGGNK